MAGSLRIAYPLTGWCLLTVIVSCGGGNRSVKGTVEFQKNRAYETIENPSHEPPSETASAAADDAINRDEIVPLLTPIPAPLTDDDRLPEDPAFIRKEVTRLTDAGEFDDALPLIDVLLILNPNDLEILEIRGRILLREGFVEDSAVDLGRCCAEGRESCCH